MDRPRNFAGIAVTAPVPLDDLAQWSGEASEANKLEIVTGDAGIDPAQMPPGRMHRYLRDDGGFEIAYGQVAAYLIEKGQRITVCHAPGHDDDHTKLELMGVPLASVLFQRAMMPLHAVALDMDGHGVAVAGLSGAGKSTLGVALLARGARLIAEDLAPLSIGVHEHRLLTGNKRMRLWPHSLQHLYGDTEAGEKLRAGIDKRGVRFPDNAAESLPLKLIVFIERGDTSVEVNTTLSKGAIAQSLIGNINRKIHMPALGVASVQMGLAAKVAMQVPAILVRRGANIGKLDHVADVVEATLKQLVN